MWACFIVFSPQEGMMHIIICSSRAFVWAPEETKENKGQKSTSVPCGEGKTRSWRLLHAVKFYSSSKF